MIEFINKVYAVFSKHNRFASVWTCESDTFLAAWLVVLTEWRWKETTWNKSNPSYYMLNLHCCSCKVGFPFTATAWTTSDLADFAVDISCLQRVLGKCFVIIPFKIRLESLVWRRTLETGGIRVKVGGANSAILCFQRGESQALFVSIYAVRLTHGVFNCTNVIVSCDCWLCVDNCALYIVLGEVKASATGIAQSSRFSAARTMTLPWRCYFL